MYLKKIEAQGFKSFANKIVFDFEPGIIGIVGPNGSGKSNVADAVRWVLGEQSAKTLRGSNMQDVIFAGTENRKPLGYAYVSLTIDNEDHALAVDFDEVIVTRRVYRSGESEYLLNNNACRLRDISELFYDTGVGKEGYSIIGQGQIDKILSTKPEDRRELFDEAAGIVKFKKRKDIAVKKLDDEQNSILRVSDVLGEIEKTIGPVREQAEIARKYLKLRDELKYYEVGAFFRESEELKRRLGVVAEKLEVARNDFETANNGAEQMRIDFEKASRKRDCLDRQVETNREELSGKTVEKENIEGRILVLNEQISTLKSSEDQLRERLAELDAKRAAHTAEKETFAAEKGELNDKLDAVDDEITAAQEALEEQDDLIRAMQHELDEKQSNIIVNIKSKADISADNQGIAAKLEAAQESRKSITEAVAGFEQTDLLKLAQEKTENAKIADIRKKIEAVAVEIEDNLRKSGIKEREKGETEGRLASAVSEYQVAATKLESLTNMAERYDGYGDSIRHVMSRKKANSAIRGVVADIISVEKKYETAIETALGGHIQNVVTEDEATAKSLVEYLKSNRLGRVTFLPMDAVKGQSFPAPEAFAEIGAIDTANKLVKSEAQYSEVIDQLLGRILVIDSISNALHIAKKYKYKLHLVTLEGEYLAPGGSITGGAFKNSSNLLGRRREIDALDKQISELKIKGDSLKESAFAVNEELGALKKAHDQFVQGLSDLRVEEAGIESALTAIRSERSRLADEKDAKLREQNELLLLITDLNSKIKSYDELTREAEKEEENRKAEAEKLIEELEKERESYKKHTEELTAIKLEFSKLEERDSFLRDNIERINSQIEEIDDEKRELLTKADPEGVQVLAKKREIEKLRKHADELSGEIRELSERIGAAVKSRDDFAEQQKSLLESKDDLSGRAASLDKDILRLTNQQERINEQIEAQISYLWNEYEMTPAEAESQRFEGKENITDIRKLIAAHKDEIRALGPVNVNAIEQEKEMGERYDFLSAQYNDLTKARDDIMNVIRELEEGMRAQFEENFAKIKAEFDIVFKELFGGGKGTLDLINDEDNNDILKSGIAIIAQPPGKKLQNMMQLSGGEKALTAIALIFAIQNLKPSPFCLVDEIEAALDERNVDRFAAYLKKLKKNTQIIAITHRRGTMEVAERLYGITMQEKGVSTLVSVDLTDPNIIED